MQSKWLFISLLVGILMGCSTEERIEPVNHIIVSNNQAELSNRLMKTDEIVPISFYSNVAGKVEDSLELRLEAELESPNIDGVHLQASSVSQRGDRVMVSYNYAGEQYAGGTDYLEIDDDELEIKSQILTAAADISYAEYSSSRLYLAGAVAKEDSQAFVYTAKVTGDEIKTEESNYAFLGSYVATSIERHHSTIYVTTGDDETRGGGIYKLNNKLEIQAFLPLHDARWVKHSNGKLYVGQGTPGKISVINASNFEKEREIGLQGANNPGAKTTLAIADNLIFFAAGENGVYLIDEETGQILHQITFPEVNTVTNAVTVDDQMIFISNGESGIYIASYDKKNNEEPKLIGKMSFDEFPSINHIHYERKTLYVAAGLGGMKVISVKKTK